MADFISLYFQSEYSRLRILWNLVYLVAVAYITTRVLSWFGYHYAHPQDIKLSVVSDFIVSGEILLPIVTGVCLLCLYQVVSAGVSNEIYKRYKFRLFRDMYDMRMHIEVPALLKRSGYVVEDAESRWSQGPRFKAFEGFMKAMFWDSFNAAAYWKLQTQTIFLLWLSVLVYSQKSALILVAIVLLLILWLFSQGIFYQMQRTVEYQGLYEAVYFNALHPDKAKPIEPLITRDKYSDRYNERKIKQREKRAAKHSTH